MVDHLAAPGKAVPGETISSSRARGLTGKIAAIDGIIRAGNERGFVRV